MCAPLLDLIVPASREAGDEIKSVNPTAINFIDNCAPSWHITAWSHVTL
jgi:hypothetical protein